MRVGVIGCGRMGRAVGTLLSRAGSEVRFGSSDAARAEAVAREVGGGATGGTYRAAASFGEVVVLAAVWPGIAETLAAAGPLEGKVLVDCTNPEAEDGGELLLGNDSGAERIARLAPGARVVKAFNHVYAQVLDRGPDFGGVPASVFLCGDDADAKAVVADLVRATGFDPVDAGGLDAARLLEPLGALVVHLVHRMGHDPGDTSFALLRR
ncbi:MAG TPA: NADPH-dependent F420 reductase [Longimicrobium sp.]|jgi:hypothetical protein